MLSFVGFSQSKFGVIQSGEIFDKAVTLCNTLVRAYPGTIYYSFVIGPFMAMQTDPLTTVPAVLPCPPEFWHALYRQKQEDYGLEWPTLDACYERACHFINPVLAGIQESAWEPASGEWR